MSIFSPENPNVLSPYLLSFFFDPDPNEPPPEPPPPAPPPPEPPPLIPYFLLFVPNEPPSVPNEFPISPFPTKRRFSDKNREEMPQKKQRRCQNNPFTSLDDKPTQKSSGEKRHVSEQIKEERNITCRLKELKVRLKEIKARSRLKDHPSKWPGQEHSGKKSEEIATQVMVAMNAAKWLQRRREEIKGKQHSSASPVKKSRFAYTHTEETKEERNITCRIKELKIRLKEIKDKQHSSASPVKKSKSAYTHTKETKDRISITQRINRLAVIFRHMKIQKEPYKTPVKPHSEKTKKKMSLSHLAKSKKISCQKDPSDEFVSTDNAARSTNEVVSAVDNEIVSMKEGPLLNDCKNADPDYQIQEEYRFTHTINKTLPIDQISQLQILKDRKISSKQQDKKDFKDRISATPVGTDKHSPTIIHQMKNPEIRLEDTIHRQISQTPRLITGNITGNEVLFIKKEPFTHIIDRTLPVLQNPKDNTQSLLLEREGKIGSIKVTCWCGLHKYLDEATTLTKKQSTTSKIRKLTTSEKNAIKDKMKDSMREWLTLSEEDRSEYYNRLDAIYKIAIPLDMGINRGSSTFAKRDIKQFEVLGPYAGVLREGEEGFLDGRRQYGVRRYSEYLFATNSDLRGVDGFQSGNHLRYVNTGQFGDCEKIGDNNICGVRFGKNLTFYVANRDIEKEAEFFVSYGLNYDPNRALTADSEIKTESPE